MMIYLPTSGANESNFQSHNIIHSPTSSQRDVASRTRINPIAKSNSTDICVASKDLGGLSIPGDAPTWPMPLENWGGTAHLIPASGRMTHQRESSLSSLGSTEPASPYTQNIANPQIVAPDSVTEGVDMQVQEEYAHTLANYYHLAKSMEATGHAADQRVNGIIPSMACPVAMQEPERRVRGDQELLLSAKLPGNSVRSQATPINNAAVVESPMTNHTISTDLDKSCRRKDAYHNVPKLDRTMTDVYSDELYNPDFVIMSSSSPLHNSVASSGSDVFNQRINAANHQHLSAAQSPSSTGSRARSPFRNDSPFASSLARSFAVTHPYRSTKSWEDQDQEQCQQRPMLAEDREPETPKTISPKDALLEFHEMDTDGTLPLFPQEVPNFDMSSASKPTMSQDHETASFGVANSILPQPNSTIAFLPSQAPNGIQVPQQYPFIAQPAASRDSPPRLSSSGASSLSSGRSTPTGGGRPITTGADSGTYTCTYHGCTLRFETPLLLQKHKREGHRQSQCVSAPRVPDLSVASNYLNTQAGPHRCDRVNPSTGKPCDTIFSRPYDLTRHEDTIHNARKQKVRCNLCTEEKTFSRADALTRHYRVCHPDQDLPGKSRRRMVA